MALSRRKKNQPITVQLQAKSAELEDSAAAAREAVNFHRIAAADAAADEKIALAQGKAVNQAFDVLAAAGVTL